MKFDILSEYCFVNMGQSPASETYNNNADGLPFYQGNADFGEIHPQTRIWCSAPVKIANKGDLLISVRAPIGALNIATEQCCIGRGLAALTPKLDKCRIKYIYFAIQSQINFLIANGTGSTFKAVNKNTLENLLIPVSSLNKQDEIVNIFEKLNNIINKRKEQLLLMDNAVKSRFIEMFGDVVINSKNWEQTTLKNVAIGKLTYGSGASAINFNGKIRYIRITDISNDGELNDDIKSPSICDNKYLLNDGDILFARSGATVGKTFCFNKKRYGEAIYAGYLIRMIPDKKRVLPIYVFYYTKTDYYMSFISKAQKAVAQPNINAQEYGDLKICVPPIELQQRFVDFVKQTDKSKLEIQKSLDKLEILKKSLMQQYFG